MFTPSRFGPVIEASREWCRTLTSWTFSAKRSASRWLSALHIREVLHQCAAPGDVDDLGATANTEDGDATLDGCPDQGDLEGVTSRVDLIGVRRAGGGVDGGVDVTAAAQHQTVEVVEGLVGGRRIEDRQDQREPAGAQHGVDVGPVDGLGRHAISNRR